MIPSEPLLDEVRQAARWTPEDPRVRVTLAKLALQRFEEAQKHGVNPMALGQVRDAAIRSRFASRQELDAWLDRAIGQHRHYLDEALRNTRQALHFGPLLGEAYLYLADLCFLENAQPETKAAYVQQALKVRPFAPDILLVAGKEAAFSGDWENAIAYWRKAFHSSTYGKRLVIRLMAEGNVPLEFLVEQFRPGWPEIHDVFLAYQPRLTPSQHQLIREQYAAAAQAAQDLPPKELGYLYFQMSYVFADSPDEARALELLQKAIEIEPNSLEYRQQFGEELARQGYWSQAEEQLTWCLQRRPDDKHLKNLLATATRQRVESGNRSAANSMESPR
jgi:tetratricopeptide (TPR) repeat protein